MSKDNRIYFEDSWNTTTSEMELLYIIKALDEEVYLETEFKTGNDKFKALSFTTEAGALSYIKEHKTILKTRLNISFWEIVHFIVI